VPAFWVKLGANDLDRVDTALNPSTYSFYAFKYLSTHLLN